MDDRRDATHVRQGICLTYKFAIPETKRKQNNVFDIF
jgi:hypothetical protein